MGWGLASSREEGSVLRSSPFVRPFVRLFVRSFAALAVLSALAAFDPCSAREVKGSAPERVPDIETFMKIGACGQPILTRDGERLYFSTSLSGTRQLYRLTDEGWPYQLTFFPNGIGYVNLSNDESFFMVTAARGGDEQYQIYRVDARTGALEPITRRPETRFTVPLFSPDDRTIYFSANLDNPAEFYVYEQDLQTGARRAIVTREGWNGVTDISRDGRYLLLYHATSSLDNNLYRYDLRTGRSVHLTPHTGNVEHSAALFAEDPMTAYVVVDDNPDGIPRLAVISRNPPRRTWMFPDARSAWPIEDLGISTDYRILGWTANEGGWGRLRLWDLESDREVPFPELDGIVGSFSLADDGRLAYDFSSPTRAPDVWTWKRSGGFDWGRRERGAAALEQRTFSSYAGIDPDWFSEPELIQYESFDGMKIPAFLYLPKNRPSGPIPFIIDVHGGPEGQFRPYFNRHFQYLMLNGYGLLAPNVRGSDGYGRDYLDADNYKNRWKSVKDLAWAAKHLIDAGLADQDQIGVKGGSYGGYMTLAAMTEYPEYFSAGIDQIGIANFETFLENTASYRREFRESEYGPLEDREFLRSISPIHKVDRIDGALFVVHGENDPRVPVSEARQILAALNERGVPADSLIFPDEGHGISKLSNRLVYYRRMVEFFDRHLK
ncbi:MAG: prolyl oligopeptidase family serine peptidase [Candidatus Latescibacteria bacterium]|nr:prolyl oligopeptidase family serine peptidase [Candidatus Latescibacterota bacterium]